MCERHSPCHPSSSCCFLFFSVSAWILLCVPGNVVTLYMHFSAASSAEGGGGPVNVTEIVDDIEEVPSVFEEDTGANANVTIIDEGGAEGRGPSCHEKMEEYALFLSSVKYWLHGWCLCIVGSLGLFGNGLAFIVLGRKARNGDK